MTSVLKSTRGDHVTRIEEAAVRVPMSRLGGPSGLPRFRWQQPIPSKETPPNVGLNAEESAHPFAWGEDSILPYRVYDDYDRAPQPGEMPLVTLTNGRLRVSVAPQYGGRLMELHDLALGRDLVFRNPVFQPANLAALNAWFSGGIEWNGLIPGHTPFTCAPVFAGITETERGPVLRLYEFDRIVEATWQIDLFLPDDDDRLFVHGRIVNSGPKAKFAYWWTNVAVPTAPGMRVLSPADYAIEHVLPGNQLERFAFPDPARFDGSYPGNWRDATSVFFRQPQAKRLFIAALDQQGTGLAQTATGAMRGRKFFYFGTAAGGQHWMDYLSLPGEGDYIEIQSGIAPTQNQRFELPPGGEIHWTEAYGALSVAPAAAHDEDYKAAVTATAKAVDLRFPESELEDIDAFLTRVSRQPVGRRIAEGVAWGGRHERLTGRALAAGLDFSTAAPKDCWEDLLDKGGFSAASLAAISDDIAVSESWVAALEQSGSQSGETWLHALLLGIAALDRDETAKARDLFERSLALKPTWLGFRQRALVAADKDAAEQAYLAAWAAGDAPASLAVEIVRFLLDDGRLETLGRFVSGLPDRVQEQERIVLSRALLAARRNDLDELEALLGRQFATIREGETLPEDLWIALQRGRLEAALGRPATPSELSERLKLHPLPEHLDFRMHVASEIEEN
ncbi:DUF5107 domain-containing protein [Aminobacter sp. BE322]|uniref:DUF5107 domain-containing protein n=1 Tax=unclassified Aminobacter TaxID=2644704 RepID=UPI003D2445AA